MRRAPTPTRSLTRTLTLAPTLTLTGRHPTGAECGSLGSLVLRRLNGYCVAKLHAAAEAVRAEGGQAVCIDEAACIDAALRELAWRGDDPRFFWRDGMHLSEAGHASLADEVSPRLLPYLLHTADEGPPGLGGLSGAGKRSSGSSHSRAGHRGGRSGDSWVPSYMQGYMPSTLARLLCCKSVVYTELES